MNNDNIFTPPHPLNTAVLFLVFNRLDTTKQVFEAIRQAKPPRLYVAADGAREGEAEEVKAVREYILQNIDWECKVKTLFREKNLGCKYAVSGGITWFFEQEEQGIILEDDCLPTQSFFWFCEELLFRYAKDLRIAQVCGFNSSQSLNQESDYFFSNLGSVWGWASWKRAWLKYDIHMKDWPIVRDEDMFRGVYVEQSLKTQRYQAYDSTYKNKIDTWDFQWAYTRSLNSQLNIFPSVSLIKQLGFDSRATHTKKKPKWVDLANPGETSIPIKIHPIGVTPSWRYEREMVKQFNQGPLRQAIKFVKRVIRATMRKIQV